MQLTLIQTIVAGLLPLIFAITVHEVAHGWVAWKLGDPTAKNLGRLTLNPLRHIDLLGTVIVPILLLSMGGFVLGWAKPVPVNSKHFKKFKRDTILVSLAGVTANLFMAILWAMVAKLGLIAMHAGYQDLMALIYMGQMGIAINLWLMLFNLLPIPPLDGSHVVMVLLPPTLAQKYMSLSRYGLLILVILLATGIFDRWLYPMMIFIHQLFLAIFNLPF